MSSPARIYLDNAATSWPKPEPVYRAVDHYQRQLGAPAGRSGYAEAVQVSQTVETARHDLARLLGVRDASHLLFTAGGTDSLNLALHGLLRPRDHVVTTVIEHNSVLRPLAYLQQARDVSMSYVGCGAEGIIDPDDVKRAITPRTRLVALSHASNVTGAIQPLNEIIDVAHRLGALVVVDAAQTVGHLPISVADLEVDLLAASGHKGLLGALGTGLLYVRPGVESQLESLRQGGTGTQSNIDRQPDDLPGKYESGSLNVPGLFGLGAAAEYLRERGIDNIRRHDRTLAERLLAGLAGVRGVRLYGPRDAERRLGVVSISVTGYDPQEVAANLDYAYRIQVRAGLHCAPLMHRALNTEAAGGTVRLSLGAFNTAAEVDAAVTAVAEIASACPA